VWRERFGGAEALEGSARLVEAALHTPGAICGRGHSLLAETDHRLEQVVVEPHFVVELIEQQGLGHGVETLVAEEGSDLGKVLLFDETVVVLVKRAAAGEFDALGSLSPEADEVVVAVRFAKTKKNSLPLSGWTSRTRKGRRARMWRKASSMTRWLRPRTAACSHQPVATSVICTVCT
jgi:hypothetical protein